jgi:hypothetical protein
LNEGKDEEKLAGRGVGDSRILEGEGWSGVIYHVAADHTHERLPSVRGNDAHATPAPRAKRTNALVVQ